MTRVVSGSAYPCYAACMGVEGAGEEDFLIKKMAVLNRLLVQDNFPYSKTRADVYDRG